VLEFGANLYGEAIAKFPTFLFRTNQVLVKFCLKIGATPPNRKASLLRQKFLSNFEKIPPKGKFHKHPTRCMSKASNPNYLVGGPKIQSEKA